MKSPIEFDREVQETIELLKQASPGIWTAEPHGKYVALYSDRDDMHHGFRLMNLDDGDANYENNISAIVAAVNGYTRVADALIEERKNSKEWCDTAGRAQIKCSEIAEKLDGIDSELAAVLSLLWERSTEEQRATIKMNYPNWNHGDYNVFIKWSPVEPDDIEYLDDIGESQ